MYPLTYLMLRFKRLKAALLKDASPANSLPALQRSWDIRRSLYNIRTYRWTRADFHYFVMAFSFTFCFCLIKNPPFFLRLAIALLLVLACLLPITSQFFVPALPIFCWLVLFYTCQFIPHSWRPRIYVRVLPALETILYGGNLSEILSSQNNNVLDLLAWIPYGLVHFAAPFIVSALCFVFGPPKTLPVFAHAFGWMNFVGVTIQLCFPTAPPWYEILNGFEPANYSMPGSPGGLERIDRLLGLNMYTGTFTASPMVFGAFPSLHSGCAIMEALFLVHLFPTYSLAFYAYVLWIWWSTMYLTHHYFVDLVGGAILSFVVFQAVKLTCLPHIQSDKFARWSYDYIETGPIQPPKLRKSFDLDMPLYKVSDQKVDEIATRQPPSPDSIKPSNPKKQSVSFHHSQYKSSSYHVHGSDLYPTSAVAIVNQLSSQIFPGSHSAVLTTSSASSVGASPDNL